ERVGKDGVYFQLWKLRSMRTDAESGGAKWAQKNDPRITKVGAFIRKTRIDELPQFINVLKGEMSIVGPRPERPMFTAEFNRTIPG
ncbi:sugar transferase, partial [Planococcus sp. SIMBA_160]